MQATPWAREACAPAACAPYASLAAPRSLGLGRLVQAQVRARPWVAEAASWVQRGHHVFRVGATGRWTYQHPLRGRVLAARAMLSLDGHKLCDLSE